MEETRNITLTKRQMTAITDFISITENYRIEQINKWESFIGRTELDGTLTAPNAEMYAKFLRDLEKDIQEVKKIIRKESISNFES